MDYYSNIPLIKPIDNMHKQTIEGTHSDPGGEDVDRV